MPEIILPAGASICAFALAICTWYGALRNGVQLVYNDIQAARSFDRDVVAMAEELLRQKRAIEDWEDGMADSRGYSRFNVPRILG